MAEVAIRSLHAAGKVPAVMQPTPFPPTATGEIKLLAIWNEWIPNAGIYLPFQPQVDDWLITVVTPTVYQSETLLFSYMDLDNGGYWQIDYLPAGVYACRVARLWGGLPPMLHTPGGTPMKVTLFVYRGVQEVRIVGQPFNWNQSFTKLSSYIGPQYYSAPAAEIVRLTYARMYPELSPITYDPYHGYWGDVIPVEEYPVNSNWQVTLHLNSRQDLSPADEATAYATAAWDPKYDNDAWGRADFYTMILSTQAVDLLDEDLGNPAPVGSAHLPIGVIPTPEAPRAIVDEDGNVIVDENDNILIWG